MKCEACGTVIQEEATFCHSCGNILNNNSNEFDEMKCVQCGNINPLGAAFCVECGSKLKDGDQFCTECGSKLKDGDRFCTECGCEIIAKKQGLDAQSAEKSENTHNLKRIFAIIIIAIIIIVPSIICFSLFLSDAKDYPKEELTNPQEEQLNRDEVTEEINYPGKGQYKLLAYGDGYYLVSNWVENYKEAYTEYGIIDQNHTWLIPLSNSNSIARAADGFSPYAESYYDLKFDYANEGMFIVRRQCCIFPESIDFYNYTESYIMNGGCYVINVETKKAYEAGAFMTKYYDGYCFYLANRFGKIIRMDKNGNKLEFTKDGKIPWGEPSNGMIYINQKFYDVKTAKIRIDLSEYDMVYEGSRKFDENGHFKFSFRNPAGTLYEATIDTTGEMIDLMT